ncbi:MAG: aldehyde ferredoxin oxidoreductase family protein [Candidatus Lokiarchaeota archaeon]|nr:aldehyde ferredoxin oxidoreductase family protein [Candidatus Lokiarchaeota archaeon]
MPNGYLGKILWVNLSDETFQDENISEEVYRQYLGGYGLATKLIYQNMPAKLDALSAESIFGFFPGLLTGTVAPLTGRFMVAGKSPLTGTWGDSNCGGYFGPEIKKCGYDAILFKGAAKTPKYITVLEGKKQILDASEFWGLDVVQTEEKLIEKHGKVQIASIGQSGEKLSLISGIVTDKARVAGRSGLGAVMGSKKLKAIVLKGNQSINVLDKNGLLENTKLYNEGIQNATGGAIQAWKTMGTTFGNVISFQVGDTPCKNWGGTKEDFPDEKLNKISGAELLKFKQKSYGCFSCSVQCGAIMKVPEVNLEETHRPEYETCASFGHLLLNDDLISIFTANDLCNRAGLDTISAGGTIAFAIECFENGILGLDDTDGINLTWGNSKAIIEVLKKIINREGIGDVLADGCKIASEKIGKGSESFAIHALGQELGMHSAKYYKSMGASFAFDPTPGRHTTATLDMLAGGPIIKPDGLFEGFTLPRKFKRPGEDRSEAEKLIVGLWQSFNSLGLCEFIVFFQQYPLKKIIKSILGWDLSIDELVKIGIRIQTLRQAFSLREGVDIINSKLSDRTVSIDYLEDYKGYCEKMGWNPETGYPLKETLIDLNLDFVVKDLF